MHQVVACLRLMTIVAVVCLFCGADDPAPEKSPKIDAPALPPGTVLLICQEVKDALDLIPGGVVLGRKEYQSLIARLAELERQAKNTLSNAPTSCRITGRLDGAVFRLQIQYEFVTERPESVVPLGCRRAFLKPGAQLDGRLPLLTHGDDGVLRVQVSQPGVHKLMLEVEVPLVSRGSGEQEQGIDFSLPGSAITVLDQFTFTPLIREVRLNGRPTRLVGAENEPARLEAITLGPIQRLEITWRNPSASARASIAHEAEARMSVGIQHAAVVTDVDMTLRPIGGEVRHWQVMLPADAAVEMRPGRVGDDRIESIELPTASSRVLTVRLREASSEPLRIAFRILQPRGQSAITVGPVTVPGAIRMRGTIAVVAPADHLLRFHPRADVVRRAPTEDARRENAVAEFVLGQLPAITDAGDESPLLVIDVDEMKGADEAQVDHASSSSGGRSPGKPEVAVQAVADLKVSERSIAVRQVFTFQFSGDVPRSVQLTVPEEIANRARIVSGGTLQRMGVVELAAPNAREQTIEIEYSIRTPASNVTEGFAANAPRVLQVPLVSPPSGTKSNVRARVWTSSDAMPSLEAGSAWEELPVELAPEHSAFPALVVRCMNDNQPLVLSLEKTARAPGAIFVERALIRADASGRGVPGFVDYQAELHLRAGEKSAIDLALATPATEAEVWLDGRRITRIYPIQAGDGGPDQAYRIEIPADVRMRAVQVAVRYRLPDSRGMFGQIRLYPPKVRSGIFVNPLEWHIDVASGKLPIILGATATAEWSWGFRNGLVTPQAPVRNDGSTPSISGWQSGSAPLDFVAPSRLGWFVSCSTTFLALGLFLSLAQLSARVRWMVCLLVAAVLLLGAAWQPDLVRAIAFGCEPGAIGVVAVLGARHLARWSYRRRVDHLPGFQRRAQGWASNGIGGGLPHEPSTIITPSVPVSSLHARPG